MDSVTFAAWDPSTDLEACCRLSYGHPAARWLLGDSFHPGGLSLTSELAERLDLREGQRVLDAGSGLGTTAIFLAEGHGCDVTGVTLEEEGIEAATAAARDRGVSDRTTFVQGDIREPEGLAGEFDAVIMECVLSILPDKARALDSLHSLMGPGGRLGLTDVTVDGDLPPELGGIAARVGCLGGALSREGYAILLEESGFGVEVNEDCADVAAGFLESISTKLKAARIATALGGIQLPGHLLDSAGNILETAQRLAAEGVLGYAMLIARKRE